MRVGPALTQLAPIGWAAAMATCWPASLLAQPACWSRSAIPACAGDRRDAFALQLLPRAARPEDAGDPGRAPRHLGPGRPRRAL